MASDGDLTVRLRAALALTPEDDLATWLPAAKAERAKHQHAMFQTPAVKIFADGVVEGHTAYLDEPYADALEYKGDASYPRRADLASDRPARRRSPGSTGPASRSTRTPSATRPRSETLDALAYARKVNRAHDWRPGITHLQLVDPKDFTRFAKLGVTAVPRPVLVHQGRLLHLPAAAVPRPAARGPRVPDEELLRRRRDRGVGERLPGHHPAGSARWASPWASTAGMPGYVWEYPAAAEPRGRALAGGARDRRSR